MATADGDDNASAWSEAAEQRRKPKKPGRYAFQPSTDYHRRKPTTGGSEKDIDSFIDAHTEQSKDDDVEEVESLAKKQ
eukprot:4044132-Amphidinium_carterae.2